MININQLKCFVSLATELSYRRAAESLNITQPPLTRQIQLLEHHIGAKLVIRNTRTVKLTSIGKTFYLEAKNLLEHMEQVEQVISKISSGEIGSISIGSVANGFYEFIPKVMAKLDAKHSNIHISVQQINTLQQIDAIASRKLDLGVIRTGLDNDTTIQCKMCVNEPFIAILPKNHPLANKNTITLSDFHKQSMIMYSVSWKPLHDLVAMALEEANVKPNIKQYERNTTNILTLVNAGLGIAIVPKSAEVFSLDNVCYKPLDPPEILSNKLYCIWRKDNDNPVFNTILNIFLKHHSVF